MATLNLRPQSLFSRGTNASTAATTVAQAKELLLERQWTFWYHTPCSDDNKYEGSRERLHDVSIKTIFDFWCHFNNIRGPGSFLGPNKHTFKIPIAGWSFFESEIKPDWEDPKNVTGVSLTFKIQSDANSINLIWRDVLMGLAGETIPHSKFVVGARITYKNKAFRLELWTSVSEFFVINEVRGWTEEKIPKTPTCSVLLYYDTPHNPQQKEVESLSKPSTKKPRPKPVRRFEMPRSVLKK